jgi:hypothetical protein
VGVRERKEIERGRDDWGKVREVEGRMRKQRERIWKGWERKRITPGLLEDKERD